MGKETNRSIFFIFCPFGFIQILVVDITYIERCLNLILWMKDNHSGSETYFYAFFRCVYIFIIYMYCLMAFTLFYNGEFDPGSGWTLAIGLTHASRGETALSACTFWTSTGARVSIAYPTCPLLGDNPLKDGLIPDAVHWRHLKRTKDFIGIGWGCVRLACWRGNGPPRHRSVGVLRGRSPT